MKDFVAGLLARFAKKRLERFNGKLVAVAGSIGKTSTTQATAVILSQHKQVLAPAGNYNTEFGLPLVLLELEVPSNPRNPFAWTWILARGLVISRRRLKYDYIVLEVGVDKPGDMAAFGKIIQPDIAVVTATTPEHMEFFKTLSAVEKEEISIIEFSKKLLVHADLVPDSVFNEKDVAKIEKYGPSKPADYRITIDQFSLKDGYDVTLMMKGKKLSAHCSLFGEHSLQPMLAAASVAYELNVPEDAIVKGIAALQSLPGRMQLLEGIAEGSWIIDDSYNAVSPVPVKAALDTLYATQAKQRIAILGNMNELGDMSEEAHSEVGSHCDSKKLDYVVTVGDMAEKWLAKAAAAKGCQVMSFKTAPEAGRFVVSKLQPGGVVLAKGSQGNVYLEEAIKLILRNSDDNTRLVRQSSVWQAKKNAYFASVTG